MKHLVKTSFVWAGVGYCIVVLFLFRQAIIPPEGMLVYGDDIHRAYYFFREFFNHWMSRGVFPWWNPYLFSGMPFIADPIVNIWYLPNWLFFVFPLNLAYSWHIALHLVWAGLGMCLLMRLVTNSAISSWVSGVMFMFSGFFMARMWSGHVDVIAAASWMPWVVHAFARVLRAEKAHEKKYAVSASMVFALQLLSGYQTMAFMTVMIVAVLTVLSAIAKRQWQWIAYSIGAGVTGIALAAFHILPVQEFFRLSIRTYHLPYSWISYGSWTMKSLILLLSPFFFGDQRNYNGPSPNFGEHSVFVGVGGLILAIIGAGTLIFMRKKRRTAQFLFGLTCLGVTIFGIWMSLGPNASFDLQYIAWKIIPMYRYLRIPPRHLVLVAFGLSGLAGIGFSRVPSSPKFFRVLIAGVVMIEMILFGAHFIEVRPVPETRHDAELVKILTHDTEPYRLLQNFGAWLPQREILDFDSVMAYDIFSVTGYSPSIYRPYYDYIAREEGMSGDVAMRSYDIQVPYLSAARADTIDFLNIKYILVPSAYDPFSDNFRYTVLSDDVKNGYRLYENTTVLPRFYLKDRTCGDVHIESYTPNVIVLSVESTCDTTLMSSEVWYPGWSATVDGRNTRIDKLNNAFRALSVLAGKHTIIYAYHPTIFIIGGVISFVTTILLWYMYRRSHL